MNYIDEQFYKLIYTLQKTDLYDMYVHMVKGFKGIPLETQQSVQSFFKQFPYWGNLEIENENFETFFQKAKVFKNNLDDYIWLYEHLCDYRSKHLLYAILNNYYNFDFINLGFASNFMFKQYFDLDLVPKCEEEVFVDIGAYTGDSVQNFIASYGEKSYKKIYCYDITEEIFTEMQKNLQKYPNIEYKNKAVTEFNGEIGISRNNFSSSANLTTESSKDLIEAVTLDNDIKEKITMIKMENSQYNYTIIIPHKNTPKLLARCLASIPRRNDIQVIVIDDNSDKDIVDFDNFPGLSEENIEIIFSKRGFGAGGARNDGLKHARGKWILFADADDYYNAGFLDILDEYINSNYDIIFFLTYSNVLGKYDRSVSMNKYYEQCISGKTTFDKIKFLNWSPVNKMFSSSLISNNQIQFDEIRIGNDAFFCLKAIEAGKSFRLIPQKLYCVTYNDKSITYSKRSFQRQMDSLLINIRINMFLKEHNLSKFQTQIWTPKSLLWFFNYGPKNVFMYYRTIIMKSSLIQGIYLYIRDKISL